MMTWLLLLAAGCSVNEDNYGEHYAKAMCDLYKSCMALYYYESYDDKDECVEDTLDAYDEYKDNVYDELDCKFDDEKADKCIASLHVSCETAADDDFDDCDEVWECEGGNPGGGPHFGD